MFGRNKETKDYDFEAFTIFDSKARLYREPMLATTEEDMLRQVQSLFKDPNQAMNVLVTNAEDFSLFRIGFFSKKTGQFLPVNHEHLANLHDLRPASGPQGIVAT